MRFATYTRDSATGNDYADQRYYSSALGRFMTPDPFGGSATSRAPQTWNRYTHDIGDPINHNDPTGLNPIFYAPSTDDPVGDAFCFLDGGDCGAGGDLSDSKNVCTYDGGDAFSPVPEPACSVPPPTPPAQAPPSESTDDPNWELEVPASRFGANIQQVKNWFNPALNYLKSAFTNPNQKCATDLNNLGLSVGAIRSAASQVKLVDIYAALGSQPSATSVFNFMQANRADFATSQGNRTIYYLSSNFWQKSFADVLGTLVHEFAHYSNGIGDSAAEMALGSARHHGTLAKHFRWTVSKECKPQNERSL